MNAVRLFAVVGFALLTACGGVSVLPEPFTRERADGKIPVKTDLIREQVRAELDGMPEGEAEVARWQTIETDYNRCRLSSARATKSEAEEVFSVCMSERGYVYMLPIDAEQFHSDIAFELEKERDERLAAEKKAAEEAACRQNGEQFNESLIAAADVGNSELVKKWLSECANPNANAVGDKGKTALKSAARNGYAEVAKVLLAAGANPDPANNLGDTILMESAYNGHSEVVKILLSAGANPNQESESGFTALMYAARNRHVEIVKILLSAGANPNAAAENGWTALNLAKRFGHSEIVRILEEAGAKAE